MAEFCKIAREGHVTTITIDRSDVMNAIHPPACWGQVPVAAVVPRPASGLTEAALLAWAHERLAAYKAPRHAVFVESIPMSSAWKRHEVADLLRPILAVRERT